MSRCSSQACVQLLHTEMAGCRPPLTQQNRPFDVVLTEIYNFLSRGTINPLLVPGVDQELLASLRYEAMFAKELEER